MVSPPNPGNGRVRLGTKYVACMIVRENPQTVINCFKNFPINVAAVAIIDTGSPQDTIDQMNQLMIEAKLPGEVISRPWVDHFAFSRTEALRHAENVVFRVEKGLLGPGGVELKPDSSHPRHHINSTLRRDMPKRPLTRAEYQRFRPDRSLEKYNFLQGALVEHADWRLNGNWYMMITDADNYILPLAATKKTPQRVTIPGKLTADQYCIHTSGYEQYEGLQTYSSPHIVKLDVSRRWRWRMGRHEYLQAEFPDPVYGGFVPDIWMHSGRTGLRSADPFKYLNDAFYFEKCVARKPLKGRYWFYLAQSYKDAKRYKDAYRAYVKCANVRGWVEEIYISFINAAQLAKSVYPKKPHRFTENIIKAREMMHDQWDAPYEFIGYWAVQSQYRLGWDIAKSLVDTLPSRRTLHYNEALIGYQFYTIAATCAWKSNVYDRAEELFNKALAYPHIPLHDKQRINGDLIAMRMERDKRALPA